MSCGLSSSQLIEARRRRCPNGAAARHCADSTTIWCLARGLQLDGLVISFMPSFILAVYSMDVYHTLTTL